MHLVLLWQRYREGRRWMLLDARSMMSWRLIGLLKAAGVSVNDVGAKEAPVQEES